jgi:hypothetical protein
MSRRVAIITDIHANVPALEAALRRIEEFGADEVYCGGDLVGYGPRPNEVCRAVEEHAIPTVYGNYDHAIARDLDDCGCFYPTPKDREIVEGSVAWTLAGTRAGGPQNRERARRRSEGAGPWRRAPSIIAAQETRKRPRMDSKCGSQTKR